MPFQLELVMMTRQGYRCVEMLLRFQWFQESPESQNWTCDLLWKELWKDSWLMLILNCLVNMHFDDFGWTTLLYSIYSTLPYAKFGKVELASTPTVLQLSGEATLLLGRRCMFMFHVGQEAWPGPHRSTSARFELKFHIELEVSHELGVALWIGHRIYYIVYIYIFIHTYININHPFCGMGFSMLQKHHPSMGVARP